MPETHFHCPDCHQAFKAPTEYQGQRFDCPKCERRQSIPYARFSKIIRPITVAFEVFRPRPKVETLSAAIEAADGHPSTATLARFGVVRMVEEPVDYSARSAWRAIGIGLGAALVGVMILAPHGLWRILFDVAAFVPRPFWNMLGVGMIGAAVVGLVGLVAWASMPLFPKREPVSAEYAPTVIIPTTSSRRRQLVAAGFAGVLLLGVAVPLVMRSAPRESVKQWDYDGWKLRVTYDPAGKPLTASMLRLEPFALYEGPLSESANQHGHWTERTSFTGSERHLWYWYGEEVSEGEWHLRDRGLSRR